MIDRIFLNTLQRKLRNFPAVAVLGARQCGKTTFVRSALPDWRYVDLERPSDAASFIDDPESRLQQLGGRVILDEAQQVPELFPVLRSVIDQQRRENGQFVLLGSASLSLVKSISESLAGRVAFVEMSPLLWQEIAGSGYSLNHLWYRGGYPDAFLAENDLSRLDWFEGYTRTFIERDLAALGIDVSGPQMRKIWIMLAHASGGLWNASQLASSLGVTYKTVNRYTDILEQTFLVRKLQPYYANISKRQVKTPKILMRDTGLLHYFLGINSPEALETHPQRGASWESFVVEQLVMTLSLVSPGSRFWHWRTAGGAEVDLLLESGGSLVPVEIKLHSSPTRSLTRGMVSCLHDLGLPKGFVIYPGKETYAMGKGITAVAADTVLRNPALLLQ